MDATAADGVRCNGTRLNPYESSDEHVPHFDPSGFIIKNASRLEEPSIHVVPCDAYVSPLGVPGIGRRAITTAVKLIKWRGGLATFAKHNAVSVSLMNVVDYNDVGRAGLFPSVNEQCVFLDFHELYRQACYGPPGDNGLPIEAVLDDLARAVPGVETLPSFVTVRSSRSGIGSRQS